MILQIIYWSFLAACVSYAWRYGGGSERIGAAIIGIGSLVSVAASSPMTVRFRSVELGIFVTDVVVLAAFLLLALRSERYWPLWATGFHVVGVATHTAIIIDPKIVPPAYAIAQGFWAYPMLVAIVLGTTAQRKSPAPPAAPIS